jgi:hypothetical protein
MRPSLSIIIGLVALIMAGSLHAQNAVISIDNVTYTNPTQMRTGHVHQVSIRYNCLGLSSTSPWLGGNGFEIYSPDGADWGYLKGSAGPLVETAGPPTTYLRHYYYDGSSWSLTANGGNDPAGGSTGIYSRAGFYLATVSFTGEGYVGGSDNDIAVILEFTTDQAQADQGMRICIDTLDAITAWEWAAGSDRDFPLWDNGLGVSGPRCWELWHDCCCYDRVGDANRSGGDEPTIGDVSVMIDAKFITGTCLGIIECLQEADINKSGGHVPTCDDVTIGDISILIDYLFITGPELGLPYCMQ